MVSMAPLVEYGRDFNQTGIDVFSWVTFGLSIFGVVASVCLCQHGRVGFLPIFGYCANSYFFTNAALAVFASKLNWRDGLLSTIIMAILSEFIVLAMIITCIDLIRNDDEDKVPESQPPRRRWAILLLILYACQGVLLGVVSFFCYFRKEDLYDADPVYTYNPSN